MFETLRSLLHHQYEAALCTLNVCVERCPEALWNAPVAHYPFSQVVFHTLFFADVYLETDETSFRNQPFHLENAAFFADYEQLEDREPVSVYDRPSIRRYVQHCREKVGRVLKDETKETLAGPCGFARRNFSRAELHVYNIRHIQHHGAQLILRLRLDSKVDIPWVGSGWTV